jgi:choline-sulfatase
MSPDRPNVLLLMSDEHSFRAFSHLDPGEGGEPVHTPTLDDLADNGVVFDQTYCQSPLCGPSRICMLTGREQQYSRGWTNGSILPPELPTIPSALSAAGYETCLVGKMHLGGSRQFGGFDHRPFGDLTGRAGHQPDPLPFDAGREYETKSGMLSPGKTSFAGPQGAHRLTDPGPSEIPESLLQDRRVATETTAFLRDHVAANPDTPWFACASFSRPHDPWTAPERHFERYWPDGTTPPKIAYEGDTTDHPLTAAKVDRLRANDEFPPEIPEETVQRTRAGYFACVDYLDEVIGDLLGDLERQGLLENTVVVYTSDHGELGGEHGLWYKRTWHEASARVPFFVQLPAHRSGDEPGARLETPVSLADLFPTICGLTGVDAPETLDGVDLSESVVDRTEPDRGPVVCDNLAPSFGDDLAYRMVRDGRYKYVAFRDAPELLFDLETDPDEQHDLVEGAGDRTGDSDGDVSKALSRFREFVSRTIDWDAVAERRAADRERNEFPLEVTKTQGEASYDGRKGYITNVYHMPDGRVIDGDSPLYNPILVTDTPETDFEDYPDEE